jgi:hypothetical protein
LLTTGELESGYERAKRFYAECRNLGYPIIFKAIIGIGHEGSPIASQLGIRFFDYALSVKAQRGQFDAVQKDSFAAIEKQTPGPWPESFKKPDFVGDIVNQECYPLTQADMVPNGFRVPLPTKVLADAWNK